jgi:ubiquinone/menaquinone biosynthesis C-methylase UbiE
MGDRLFKPQDAHKLDDPERQIWLPVADVIRALAIRPGMRVADVGAGTGYFAVPIARAVGVEGKVYAVDLQPAMLAKLREKFTEPDAPRNIELVRGEANRTTLPSRCADVVFVANVWHELENHTVALQEVARILAPGGVLALLDWRADMIPPPGPPSDHRLPAAGVLQFLAKSGWTADEPADVGRYSYFISALPPNTEEGRKRLKGWPHSSSQNDTGTKNRER